LDPGLEIEMSWFSSITQERYRDYVLKMARNLYPGLMVDNNLNFLTMLGGSLVTTAWRGWKRWLPDMEGSCEYIEQAVANSRNRVVLQLYLFGL
jgi:hypothetical protein